MHCSLMSNEKFWDRLTVLCLAMWLLISAVVMVCTTFFKAVMFFFIGAFAFVIIMKTLPRLLTLICDSCKDDINDD